MRRLAAAVVSAVTTALLCGGTAAAQIVTGSLVGSVEDRSGGALAGAQVSVSSPALLSGVLVASTNDNGRFRFPRLAPGEYTLRVEAPSFQSYEVSSIVVVVGRTIDKRIALTLDGVAESLTVIANADLVDAKKISISTVYDRAYVENLPRTRADLSDFLKIAPGMSPRNDRPDQPDSSSMGSGTDDNLLLIDGGDMSGTTKDGGNTVFTPWLGSDQIESVEIINTGASAEYGNYQGAVIHVHTKRGGNEFRGHGAYFRGNDVNVGVGGPILRDQVWFYGGYEYRSSFEEGYSDRLSLKLDWRLTRDMEARFGLQGGTTRFDPRPTPIAPLETQSTLTLRAPSVTFAQLTYIPNDVTLVDVRASGMFRTSHSDPMNTSEPGRWDVTTDVTSGGASTISEQSSTRIPISAKLTRYLDNYWNASHELKLGVQFNHSSQVDNRAFPTGVDYFDDNGPWLAFFSEPTTRAATVNTFGFFVEDIVSVSGRATIHLGMRVDHGRSSLPNVPRRTNLLDETGETIDGLGPFFSWTNVSPRLGATFALDNAGATVLRASLGRYLRPAFAGELAQFHPANGPETSAQWDPDTGDYTTILGVFDPLEDLVLDRDMRALRTDTFSLGVDRQLGERSALNVSYVYKDSSDFTGWMDIGGVYGEATETLPDGSEITVFPLLNDRDDRRFTLTNRDDWWMSHHGLHVTFENRWRRRWQTLVSYSLSKTNGLQSSSVGNPGTTQMSSGGFTGKFISSDPNSMTNAEGPLANERGHLLRAQTVCEIPKIGVIFGANVQYLTGTAWAARYRARLPQGRFSIYIEPQGSNRLPARTLVDVRVSKVFRFGRDTQLEILFDVFNLLNDSIPQSIDNIAFTPRFGTPRNFTEERRTTFGVKFAF